MSTKSPRLTERQERRITRYLRDVGEHLGEIPSRDRESALAKLNDRIERELGQFPSGIADVDLEHLLETLGRPALQASRLRPADYTVGRTFVSWPDRVWLGVCAGIARKVDVDANIVRLIAVLIGLVVPLLPLLLIAYLAVFFWDYYASSRKTVGPLEPWKLGKALGGTFGVALALHLGTRFLLIFVAHAYQAITTQPLALDGRWNWLTYDASSWFFWVLVIGLPLTAISALPVPKVWAGTLRKTVHAGLALYAVWLCYGIASILVGIILSGVEQFSGSEGTDAIVSLMR